MTPTAIEPPRVLVLAADWSEPTWRAQPAREALRRLTRVALRELAAPSAPDTWPKDTEGAPAPLADGRRWSVSHAGGYAAAALTAGPTIGVDVESATRVPSAHVRERLARMGAAIADDDARGALRAWCTVEAVIKCHGLGIAHLSRVRFDGDHVLFDDAPIATSSFDVAGAVFAAAGPGSDRLDAPTVRRVGREVAA